MKIGMRTPSLKKSFKARTTGKLKRETKKAINPLYGKKGTGLLTNPKKSLYNKVYNKTTIDSLVTLKKADSNNVNNKKTKQALKRNLSLIDESAKKSIPLTKKELLTQIPKKKQVHYFDKEAHCCICNKDLGIKTLRSRYQLIDGWLCKNCVKLFCNPLDFESKRHTVKIIKNKISTK